MLITKWAVKISTLQMNYPYYVEVFLFCTNFRNYCIQITQLTPIINLIFFYFLKLKCQGLLWNFKQWGCYSQYMWNTQFSKKILNLRVSKKVNAKYNSPFRINFRENLKRLGITHHNFPSRQFDILILEICCNTRGIL